VLEAVWLPLLPVAEVEDTDDETGDTEDKTLLLDGEDTDDDVTVATVAGEVETGLEEEAVEAAVEVEAQDTAVGRLVTPAESHIFSAYCTAAAWSASEHALARQQAIPLKKFWFEQIQAMLRGLHPSIAEPVVNDSTHGVCTVKLLY
jgi:hypothetical protein